jgi:tetratricopeptide (TPR) repeat protein
MFGGLFSARWRAAERALREGRLDDCLRLVSDPSISAADRDGKLQKNLGAAFVTRGREHFRAERFAEALLDLGRADECGAVTTEAAELRGQVLAVAQEVARQDVQRRRLLEEAQQRIRAGSLYGGKRVLTAAGLGDPAVQALHAEAAQREREAATLLERAESALAQNRVDAAATDIERALRLHADERAGQLESQVCTVILGAARQLFGAGRLAAARTELARLRSLGNSQAARRELTELLDTAGSVNAALAAGDFASARQRVHRLQSLAPQTAWVVEAAGQIDRVDAELLALRSGPLGENLGRPASKPVTSAGSRTVETAWAPTPMIAAAVGSLPRQLLLMVEGGGSFLLHRDARASVGRAAGEIQADLPILADLAARHAELVRVEDDYFLVSAQDIDVGGVLVRQRLLRDGDRITLARRAKLTFRMPSRRSPSARLDLSDSTKMPHDVRAIVLFQDTALVGRGPHCHVPHRSGAGELLLFERGGGLWVRIHEPGGRGDALPVELGKQVELAGLGFTVQAWKA